MIKRSERRKEKERNGKSEREEGIERRSERRGNEGGRERAWLRIHYVPW